MHRVCVVQAFNYAHVQPCILAFHNCVYKFDVLLFYVQWVKCSFNANNSKINIYTI